MNITFGPYFRADPATGGAGEEVLPLNIAMEWANPREFLSFHIFRRRSSRAPDRIGLEHLIFPAHELPREMACQDCEAVQTQNGPFVALEGLLAAMYRRGEISRPVFETLEELASLVPFDSRVSRPISPSGLLLPSAETQGYRLNAVYRDSDRVLAHLAWQPEGKPTRFHVCAASFRSNPDRHLDPGEWLPERERGLCQVLSAELHRLVPGRPGDLMSEAGRLLLTAPFHTSGRLPTNQG